MAASSLTMLALHALHLALIVAPHRPHAAVSVRRHGGCACGATAEVLVERLGATSAEAEKAEARLLPNVRADMTAPRANAACRALQSRLGLSEAELKKVVLGLPAVLSYSV